MSWMTYFSNGIQVHNFVDMLRSDAIEIYDQRIFSQREIILFIIFILAYMQYA